MPIKDKLDELIKLYNSGLTLQQIGDKFGCSKQYIYEILKGHVKFRQGYRRCILEPYKDELLKIVKERKLLRKDIAKKFGVAMSTVDKMLKRLGIKYRAIRFKCNIDELVSLYKQGVTVKEICKRVGYKSVRSIFLHLHRLGIKLRSK